MQQYRDAKERHPDMLLLFRMGDFYELFDQDAKSISTLLGVTLTSREGQIMAGFPHHQLENYLHKLLKAGIRVAICDQVDSADGKRFIGKLGPPKTAKEGDTLSSATVRKPIRHSRNNRDFA